MAELSLLQDRVQSLIDEARDIDAAFHEFVTFVDVSKVRPLRPRSSLDDALQQAEGARGPKFYDDWGWTPNREQREQQRSLISRYELWFNAASALVYQYLPNRWDDFAVVYPYLKSLLECDSLMPHPAGKRFDQEHRAEQHRRFRQSFDRQVDMLMSVPDVVRARALQLRIVVGRDLVRADLERAERILGMAGEGSPAMVRAAGVVAGVALEKHLRLIVDEYNSRCTSEDEGLFCSDDMGVAEIAGGLRDRGLLEPSEMATFERLGAICHNCVGTTGDEEEAVVEADVTFLIEKTRECLDMEFFE